MKKIRLIFLLICLSAFETRAQTNLVRQWSSDVAALRQSPVLLAGDTLGAYYRLQMADSCYLEVQHYGDSILLIQTVCAPVCSSVASIYDETWQLIRAITPPVGWIFPQAFMENGQLRWQNNTQEILDSTERKEWSN